MLSSDIVLLEEPPIEFRYGQKLSDPHDGLAMFGPYDADFPSHPANISYGLLGTEQGLNGFLRLAHKLRGGLAVEGDARRRRLWPTYPGFEAAFCSALPTESTCSIKLNRDALLEASRNKDPNKRAGAVVDSYLDGIRQIVRRDEVVGVIVCVVPDIVYRNCRPESRVLDGIGVSISRRERKRRASGELDMFDQYKIAHYQYSVDFRRQIKARAMVHDVPIQIIRESTLSLQSEPDEQERDLTPFSDRAWNLSVAIYYKCGGKPWRLATARDGVCYVGIAYRLTAKGKESRSACCAAQMFLDTGDGVVFRGQEGRWYSPKTREFHLSQPAATNLLKGVLTAYHDLGGKRLREIFLHCRSGIGYEEWRGFKSACPKGVKLVGIRVRKVPQDVRLFREGTRPVLRGTFWEISQRTGYLWATGFKPRLATYDGWEVPVPLRIDVQKGEADLRQTAEDIFGLTKLNYNACRLGESEPVTIKFSDDVGEILVSNPTVKSVSPKFKFYI